MKTKSSVPRKSSTRKPKNASKTAAAVTTPSSNGKASQLASDVFTLLEAAAFLRVAEEDVRKLAEAGNLPGKKFGDEWRILKTALCVWLSTPAETNEPLDWRESNRRVLETFGSMADDETIPEMLENIYKERKRHPVSEIED